MTTDTRLYTADEAVAHAPYLNWELVRGRIVEMPPNKGIHGLDSSDIDFALRLFNQGREVGHVAVNMGLIVETGPDTVRCPDLVFISNERFAQIDPDSYWRVMPELVVEVKSPSYSWPELDAKAAEYLAAGVDQVWVFDRPGRRVRVYPGVDDFTDLGPNDTLVADGLLDGFTLPLATFFAAR